ncbi:hypothetical protein [Aureliella helgolandensis]|uniref:Uncharacterized protein n=1 Tax=Aureliella helgolandensis TaxID=2527968 RepID=A0A518GA96_9BACT|nr:hypothetical protein [Aureliella helgolandensis]QDV25489.1 hypothetical protein Q31a_38150 [Aureliella helgolandensis]
MREDEGGTVVIHLIRIRNGLSERLASIPTERSGSNSVQVVCDADQQVCVVAPATEYTDGQERAVLTAYYVDSDTGATTEHRATVPFGRGSSVGYGVVECQVGPEKGARAYWTFVEKGVAIVPSIEHLITMNVDIGS